MAVTIQTEQIYTDQQVIGIEVLVACGALSLFSVLSMFVILWISAILCRQSSTETPFVRTHVAIYFISLLICNLVQGVGALLNIPWILKQRVYIGPLCTAQAAIKQFGNIGTAIFSFAIAAHTFSLLFLRRRWSDRTRYIVLMASWTLLVLDMCIEIFLVADPVANGPYYGISGYWCWITPAYSTERYTSEYLFMFTSAGLSFILYFFVFLLLRGNITVSAGRKVYFHQRPKLRVGGTSGGTYISTDDRRIESQLTTIAKQMLWYPLAFAILVLPVGAARYSATSGASVPFSVLIATAALFMLSGFVNTVLFCATRSIIPVCWRKRFSLRNKLNVGSGDITLSSWGNSVWRRSEPLTRKGTLSAGRPSLVIGINVEKDVDIKYDDELTPSSLGIGPPTVPTCPLRAHGGRQRTDAYSYHVRQTLVPPPRDERNSVRLGVDGVDEERNLKEGVHRAKKPNIVDARTLAHPLSASRSRERGISDSALDLEAPAPVYPSPMSALSNNDTKQSWSPSISTSGTAVGYVPLSGASGGLRGNSSGTHWTRRDGRLLQTPRTGVSYPAGDEHPYSPSYESDDFPRGTDSRYNRGRQGV